MSLTIDATVGGTSSNSYVTLIEADAYMAARLNVTNWSGAASDDLRNRALAMATQRIDFETYKGDRTEETQALAFPRANLPYIDGVLYDNDEIPPHIKVATYELAVHLLGKDMSAFNEDESLDFIKVASITVDFAERQPSGNELPPYAQSLLSPFMVHSGGIGVGR